jgi:hypothetical protein
MKNFNIATFSKKCIIPVALALALFFVSRVYFRATDDFRLGNITCTQTFVKNWQEPELSEEEHAFIQTILAQEFYYIGKGAQSYVFSSKDDNYVIKFFKFKHLRPSFFSSQFQKERKERLIASIFEGHKLAFSRHREETGLVYIQLAPSCRFGSTITVLDKMGFQRNLPLDQLVFVLQKKTEPSRPFLSACLKRGEVSQVKQYIFSILDLYKVGYDKGLYDRDHGVLHNTGFFQGKPIHFDVGKLTDEPEMKQPEIWQEDLLKVAKKFEVWLRYNHPEHHREMTHEIEEKLSDLFAKPVSLS